jgi:transcriptional regulator with XRE-family HTH domain
METASINATWGARVRRIRREKELTATAVAKEAGIARETLHRIERGQGVSDDVKIRLAKAIGVDPNELFDLKDAS